jgi:hypothetical protein
MLSMIAQTFISGIMQMLLHDFTSTTQPRGARFSAIRAKIAYQIIGNGIHRRHSAGGAHSSCQM